MATAFKLNINNKIILIALLLVAVVAGAAYYYKSPAMINSYDKCVEANKRNNSHYVQNAINPPRCVTEDGRTFVGPTMDH